MKHRLKNPEVSLLVTDLIFSDPYQRSLILYDVFGDQALESANKDFVVEAKNAGVLNEETILQYRSVIARALKD